MPIRHSKNIRAVIYPNAVVWSAVLAESEEMGFSPSDIITRALLAQGYGKPAAQTTTKPGGKKELPPVTVWEGDPYDDPERNIVPGRRYSRPAHRWAAYTIDKLTPKQIREREDLMKRKWPQGETVYDAGLAHEDDE